MTHTKISDIAGNRLDELTSLSMTSAVISCLDTGSSKLKADPDEIMEWIVEATSVLEPCIYLVESTTTSASDPIEKVEAQLRNGFTTGGKKFDLNSVPIWKKFETETRNIRYKAHSWLMLDSLLVADEIVDDDIYLQKAIVIADDWIINFIISQKTDEFAWYDMGVGQRATKLAYMLRRLIEINAPKEQIFRFIIASEIHIVELMQEERIATHSNHGLFQMAGLIALGNSLPWFNMASEANIFSRKIIEKMLSEHFSEDGLHLEHSPDYHLYMTNQLKSLEDSGWLRDSTQLNNMISLVEEASHWLVTPRQNTIAIGDTANNAKVTKRWGGSIGYLITGLKVFEKGGLVIENTPHGSETSQLVFSAQFHSRQHKHADHLNVLYHLDGKPLLVDPGTYTYQYDLPERIYCESTRGHNTVEIDGLNYSRFRLDAFGSALTLSATIGPCTIIGGKVHHSRLVSPFIPNNKIQSRDGIEVDIIHSRYIIHFPGRFLAIVDQLESENSHEYIQWNHFSPELEIRKMSHHKYGVRNDKKKTVCVVLTADGDFSPVESMIVRGQSQPHLQGWISRNGRELIENTALGFSTNGGNSIFVTVFDFKMRNTGKPYLRCGSNGRYLRFALTQDGSKVDIIIRINQDGSQTIESIIDGEEGKVEIPSDSITGVELSAEN
jgi:hypothetical protein